MHQAIDQLAEEKETTVTNTIRWYSSELYPIKQKRDKCYGRFLATNSERWWQRYKHIANEYADKLLIAKPRIQTKRNKKTRKTQRGCGKC